MNNKISTVTQLFKIKVNESKASNTNAPAPKDLDYYPNWLIPKYDRIGRVVQIEMQPQHKLIPFGTHLLLS